MSRKVREVEMKFTIDGFEFGVDVGASNLLIETDTKGTALLSAKVCGDAKVIDKLDIDHALGWLTFPPTLYFRGLESRQIEGAGFTAELNCEDLDDIEGAMIMVEHREIDKVQIQVTKSLSVSGRLLLSDGWKPFQIEIERDLMNS
jgi:hypothetical protein